MPIRVALGFLVAAFSLSPPAALAQRPVELAFGDPEPHFVAAWAPKKPREAERSAVLVQRVSLELTDAPLDLALKTLTQRAGLNITYSPAVLPAGKRVTIAAGDIAVVTALTEMLFRSGLDVMVDRDGAMALVVCTHPAPRAEIQDSGTIVGTVTDKATGAPIAGATVLVEGTKHSATTNAEGKYRIAVEPATYTVGARYIGYTGSTLSVTVSTGAEATADFGLEKSAQRLDDVVTTGTVVPTEVRAVPTPISTMTSLEIERQHVRKTDQFVRQVVPGAVAWDLGVTPEFTTTSLRGASSLSAGGGAIKVYLDGIEISNKAYAAIDPNSIERIEVIRGPQGAALYGSDAIGGVMQVFTKRGDPGTSHTRVLAEASAGVVQSHYGSGEALRQDYRLALNGGSPSTSFNLGAGYARSGEWVPDYSLSSPTLYGGLHYQEDALTLDLSARYYAQNYGAAQFSREVMESGFAAVSAPQFGDVRNQEQTYAARIGYKPVPSWSHSLTVGTDWWNYDYRQRQPRRTTPADTFLFVSVQDDSKRYASYNTSVVIPLSSDLTGSLVGGVEYHRRTTTGYYANSAVTTSGTITTPGEAPPVPNRDVVDNAGYFAQAQLSAWNALYFTGSLRAESNTSFGSAVGTPVSSRVGLSYVRGLGATTVKLRASYGEGIRPPGPGQRNQTASAFTIRLPNEGLGPERQIGGDVGIDLALGPKVTVGLTYFNQVARDLIQLVLVDGSVSPARYQNQNVGRVKNVGVEAEGRLALGPVDFTAQFAITNSRIRDLGPNYTGDLRPGDQALLVPRHTGGLTATVSPWRQTSISLGAVFVGKWTYYDWVGFYRCLGGTGPCQSSFRGYHMEYPAFTKANLSISHQFVPTLSAFVAVENLTNSAAFELDNITRVIGRTTMAGLRLSR